MADTLLDIWDNFENVPEGLENTDLTLVDQSRALIRSKASPKEWKDCVTLFPGTGRYTCAKCNRKREKKMISNTSSSIPLDQYTDYGSAQLNQGYDESTLAYINKVEDLGVDYHSTSSSSSSMVSPQTDFIPVFLDQSKAFDKALTKQARQAVEATIKRAAGDDAQWVLEDVADLEALFPSIETGIMMNDFFVTLTGQLNTKEMEDWIVLEGVGACQPMEPLVPQLANLYDARRIGTYDPDAGYHTLPPISEHLESVRRDLDSVKLQKFVAEELRCFENGSLKVAETDGFWVFPRASPPRTGSGTSGGISVGPMCDSCCEGKREEEVSASIGINLSSPPSYSPPADTMV
ncbi:hypothetical protein BDZ91DRAFT_768962 [Kalaharituber pfeilii]|nr:hypothetical protein BDZ91DRAFT_768962 [Kalaharituber pfeilii]